MFELKHYAQNNPRENRWKFHPVCKDKIAKISPKNSKNSKSLIQRMTLLFEEC